MVRTRRMDPDEMQGAVTLEPVDDSRIDVDVSDDSEAFDKFRESGDSETAGKVIWVYRIPTDSKNNPTGEDARHLFSAPIDRYDLPQLYDRIKKDYMPRGYGIGTFRIFVRTVGQRGVHWKKLLVLEKGAHDDEPLPAPPEIKSGDPAVAALAEAMRQQNELLSRLFEARQNSVPPPDPMAQTERMLAMVASLTTAINGRPTPAVGTPQTLGEMANGFREMMKLSREFGGDSGAGGEDEAEGALGVMKSLTPWAGVLEKLLDGIKNQPARALPAPQPNVLRREPPRVAGRPPTQEEIAARAAQTQPAAPMMAKPPIRAPQNSPGGDAVLMKIVELTNDLITLKNNGGEPVGIGKTLTGMVTSDMEERLLDLLEPDDWFDRLAAFNPKIREHKEFFTAVRDAMLSEYDFERDDASEGGEDRGSGGAEIVGQS